MKKKLLTLLLALVLLLVFSGCCSHEWGPATCEAPSTCTACGKTEGEALGHTWLDATCDSPKTCSACQLTEGEALGHSWMDATTETPKTCSTCSLTEGERIITDPRFTTASTAALQGQWTAESIMPNLLGLEGFTTNIEYTALFSFGNDGSLTVDYTFSNLDEFSAAMEAYLANELRSMSASFGITDEQVVENLGMTPEEYAASQVESMDFASLFNELDHSLVYYVENDQIYCGSSWDAEMSACNFTLDGDTLSLGGFLAAADLTDHVCTRVAE